jgi:hypothetical protein
MLVFRLMLRVGLLAQVELALTVMFPEANALPTSTSMLVPPLADANEMFVGTVHVYDNAPATGAMLYVTVLLVPRKAQTLAGPLMIPGVAGALRVTEMLRVSLVLQPLTTTETLPLVKVLAKRKLMLGVPCPLTLVAPVGMVHR